MGVAVEVGQFPPESEGFLAGLECLGPASGLGQPDGVVTDRCGEVGEVGVAVEVGPFPAGERRASWLAWSASARRPAPASRRAWSLSHPARSAGSSIADKAVIFEVKVVAVAVSSRENGGAGAGQGSSSWGDRTRVHRSTRAAGHCRTAGSWGDTDPRLDHGEGVDAGGEVGRLAAGLV